MLPSSKITELVCVSVING